MHVPVLRRVLPTVLAVFVGAAPAAAQSEASSTSDAAGPSFHVADARLERLIERALTRHPGLGELRLRHEASRLQAPQARALPDPVLGFTQALQTPETRVGPQLQTLSLTQGIPWPGVRTRRAEVAGADADIAAEHLRVAERNVVREVKVTYYEVMYLDRALAITEEERLLLDQYERLAQTRYASGQGSQQAIVRLQAEITRILSRRRLLEQQRIAAAARLNTLMDDPPQTPLEAVESVAVPAVAPQTEPLVALGLTTRPELRVLATTTARRSRMLDLARTRTKPMLSLGVTYANVLARRDRAGRASPPDDNGKNPLSIAFTMTLPIWRGSYTAGIRQAALELEAEGHKVAMEQNALAREVEELTSRFAMLADQTDLFRRVLLPQAEEALRSVEAAYATGQVSVLDLLDGERVLLEVRLVLARYQADQLTTLAEIERTVGTAFPSN